MINKRPSPEWTEVLVREQSIYGYVEDGLNTIETPRIVHINDRTYTGTTTPNFKRVKSLPFNSFSLSFSSVTPSLVVQKTLFEYNGNVHPSIAYKTYSRYYSHYWALGQNFSSIPGHIAGAEALCSQRLAKSFSAIKVNLAQFFGERKQFISMVAKTAGRIVHAARSLRKLQLGDAMEALNLGRPSKKFERDFWIRHRGVDKDHAWLGALYEHKSNTRFRTKRRTRQRALPEQSFSSAWLELQYGWKPLLQDVYGAAELLGDKIRKDEFNNVVKSSAKVIETVPWDYNIYLGIGPMGLHRAGEVTRKTTCKYFATFKTTSELKSAFAVTGISNPAVLAWELLPFSFVVDWFLPVGNWLEQMTAFNGFEFTSIRRVRFSRGLLDARCSPTTPRVVYSSGVDSGIRTEITGSYSTVTYDRDTIANPGYVPLEFKSPVSVIHALNAIALISTVFGRKK